MSQAGVDGAVAPIAVAHTSEQHLYKLSTRIGVAVIITVLSGYLIADRLFAYLGPTVAGVPLYPGEIAIVVGLLTLSFGIRTPVRWTTSRIWTVAFLAWAIVVFVIRLGAAPMPDAIRDFAFVYYLAFAFFGFKLAWERLNSRAYSFIAALFLAQLVYSLVAIFRLGLPDLLGSFGQLVGRYDIEGVNLAAGAGFFLLAGERLRIRRGIRIAIAVAQIGTAMLTTSRAVFLCVVLVLGVVFFSGRGKSMRGLLFGSLGAAASGAVALAFLFPNFGFQTAKGEITFSTAFQRVLGTFGYDSDSETGYVARANAEWRLQFWSELAEHSWERPDWLILGRGFGPNLATEVGLLGDDPARPLRAPHNIAVNVFARLGLIGLALWIGWIVSLIRAGLGATRQNTPTGSLALWMFLYWGCLLIAALLGVILESPFGAAPFYFLSGGLLRLNGRHELPGPTSAPARVPSVADDMIHGSSG